MKREKEVEVERRVCVSLLCINERFWWSGVKHYFKLCWRFSAHLCWYYQENWRSTVMAKLPSQTHTIALHFVFHLLSSHSYFHHRTFSSNLFRDLTCISATGTLFLFPAHQSACCCYNISNWLWVSIWQITEAPAPDAGQSLTTCLWCKHFLVAVTWNVAVSLSNRTCHLFYPLEFGAMTVAACPEYQYNV